MAAGDKEAAEAAKALGNAAFKEKQYMTAVDHYTAAIEADPSNPLYYGNRAFAHVRLENFGSAIADADKALELDPAYAKALYRKAEANFMLSHFKDAVRDFRAAVRLAPRDPDLRKKLAIAERELKRSRFEAALSSPDADKAASDAIDLESFLVEDSYDGPRMALEGDEEEGPGAEDGEVGGAEASTRAVAAETSGVPTADAGEADKAGEPGRGAEPSSVLEPAGGSPSSSGPGTPTSAGGGEAAARGGKAAPAGARFAPNSRVPVPTIVSPYRVTRRFAREMVEAFRAGKSLHKRFAYELVLRARQAQMQLPAVVDVDVPEGRHVTVCGDVHGQFYDLLRIWEINGYPDSKKNPYLFNGDFVDRGSWSCEVVLSLFAFSLADPGSVAMTRGNHEARSMNAVYGFNGEVKAKFGLGLVEIFREAFCALPLAYVLGGKVLVLHGGLFADDATRLADLRAVDRFREPPESGPMCDALWSDPADEPGRSPNKRGVGVAFGPDVTKRFLEKEGLSLLVRSHEVKDGGYEVAHDGYCVTVFSAPNYCDQAGNKGAWIRFNGGDMTPHFSTFEAAPHPPIPPMKYAGEMGSGMFGM